jgi:hypothetical protein
VFRIGQERFTLTSGRLHVTAAPMVARHVELGGVILSVPFSVTGFLLGEGVSGIGRVDLFGSGTVTTDFGGDVEGPFAGIALSNPSGQLLRRVAALHCADLD